ncbi:Uncharacterised protein [Klebsiella aerogenes]|nr:Uncharacterised protein [Klebsiella aerogenes]
MVSRHFRFRFYEGGSADNTIFAITAPSIITALIPTSALRPITTAVQDCAVADVAVLFHHGILAGEAVHDAVILNIGSVFYYNYDRSRRAGWH